MGLRFILACVMLSAMSSLASAQVPLPSDLSIRTPGPDVPAADAAFSGAWGNGAWYGLTQTALIVEQVDQDGTAKVIYARGATEYPCAADQFCKSPALWLRLTGRIEDGRLTIHLPDPNSSAGFLARYRVIGPGHLEGDVTTSDGWRGHAFLQRIPGPANGIIATAALPFRPTWRELRIPEHSSVGTAAGQTFQLAATLYRTRLPGRQPLVILNHGSAFGTEEVARTWYFQAAARFFLARGYSVVVPMRKGRGDSGGPFLEPDTQDIPTAIQVESAVEDEDTVLNAMRAEPWVDPARIIVSGWSRGGFLSVVYAARHPDKVAGVINFSGGWWSEYHPGSGEVVRENRQLLAAAGKTARVPELWLYADNDMFYSLTYTRKIFDAFRANGGTGDFLTFGNVSGVPSSTAGNGHALFEHVGMWEAAVTAYLQRTEDARTP